MEHSGDDGRGRHEPSAEGAQKQLQPPTESPHEHHDTFIAETLSSGLSVTNGSVLPPTTAPPENGSRNANNNNINNNNTTTTTAKDRPISGVVPPYWRQHHQRDFSRSSLTSVDTGPSSKPAITLEDHTADPNSETSRGLWAKSVTIEDHVVVTGMTGVGAYVVWICKIQTLDGGPMMIRMRYSEFDELRALLVRAFPHARNALPPLPPKSVLFKFRPNFLESRRMGLQYFLHCVLLNPEFSGSPVLKDFLFSHRN